MMRQPCLCVALLFAAPAIAQNPMVIYHCTDAAGAVTVQNDTPCPAGSTQRTRKVDPPPPLPAYVPMAAPPQSTAPRLAPITRVPKADDGFDPAALVIDLELQPPPPLFLCTTYDQTRYYSESGEPESRCQPMATVGIGGLPGLGAGAACVRVTDVCEPVPDDALCSAWDTRVREAEFRWRFAGGHYATEDRLAEYEALAQVRDTSTCAAE